MRSRSYTTARRFLYAVVAMAALLAPACADERDASPSADAGALAFGQAGDPADATETIEIIALDAMTFEPTRLNISQGDTILFRVINEGTIAHEFTIGDQAMQESHEEEMSKPGAAAHDHPYSVWLEPGETKELAWEFTASGDFQYGCHVPGHYAAGMVGDISVE